MLAVTHLLGNERVRPMTNWTCQLKLGPTCEGRKFSRSKRLWSDSRVLIMRHRTFAGVIRGIRLVGVLDTSGRHNEPAIQHFLQHKEWNDVV